MYGKLSNYVTTCFMQAAEQENRTLTDKDFQAEYIIVDGDVFVPIFSCKFERVLRRVHFRLRRNLPRNFALRYNLDEHEIETYRYTQVFDNEVWSRNHALALVTLKDGKKYFIEDTPSWHVGDEETIPYIDIPAMAGISKDRGEDRRAFWKSHKTFAEYRDLYRQCYGEWPEHQITGSDGVVRIEK